MNQLFKRLYIQVIVGILLGIVFGTAAPDLAIQVKPLADIFIKLIKMMITPIIFLTLVSGITAMSDMKTVGKMGGASIIYFLLTTTCALFIGLIVANTLHPGTGLNIDLTNVDLSEVNTYVEKSESADNIGDFLLNIIPTTFFSALVKGNILQVLFVSIIFSLGLMAYGQQGRNIGKSMDHLSKVCFKIIHAIMYYSPVAAFAAMAFTVGNYGAGSLIELAELLFCFYATCLFFIFVVLGSILYFYCNVSIFNLLEYIKEEIFIVFATSSSESVLPNLLEKLAELGCHNSVVDLVIPTGYSFNLDGTAIYLTLAALFIAQATQSDLTYTQQLFLLLMMIISSKGAAGVTGSGFIVLATSLAAINTVPVAGVVIILGIDRFMSVGRSLTNVIGNTVATIVIAKWQKLLDVERINQKLNC